MSFFLLAKANWPGKDLKGQFQTFFVKILSGRLRPNKIQKEASKGQLARKRRKKGKMNKPHKVGHSLLIQSSCFLGPLICKMWQVALQKKLGHFFEINYCFRAIF